MTTTIEGVGSISDFLIWNLQTGIWNGRPVAWTEASEFYEEVKTRLFTFLFENPSSPFFEHAVPFAWIKSTEKIPLAREIQALDFSKQDLIVQVSLGKRFHKFWKKHKTEILIGAAVLVAVTVIAVVAISAGTVAGGAAAIGRATLDPQRHKEPEKPQQTAGNSSAEKEPVSFPPNPAPSIHTQKSNVTLGSPYSGDRDLLKKEIPAAESLSSKPFSPQSFSATPDSIFFYPSSCPLHLPSNALSEPQTPFLPKSTSATPSTPTQVVFGESGIYIGDQYSPYSDLLKDAQRESLYSLPSAPSLLTEVPDQTISLPVQPDLQPHISAESKKSWVATILDTVGRSMITSELMRPESEDLPPRNPPSSRFSTMGTNEPHLRIGGINGINTSLEEAMSHAQYTANLTSNHSVDWVHNQTHGSMVDLLEVFTLNYMGSSPNNGRMLQENWTVFHEQNANNSHAKYLQICHSQGAIHVRNALANCPKEIRGRVIVIAIAPAAIVPRESCYKSYNYASKKDVVHYGELVAASALNPNECGMSKRLEIAMEYHNELILLDPHPDATGIDHDYESPTFLQTLKDHVQAYLDGEI